jgi:hypothetical protein
MKIGHGDVNGFKRCKGSRTDKDLLDLRESEVPIILC